MDDGVPSREDWQNARRMITFLQHFYELTLRISGSLYTTSNLFFHEIFLVYRLLGEWIKSDDEELSKMAKKMKEKYDKYWGDPIKMNQLIFIAVILDPRHKLDWVQFIISKMYEGQVGIELGIKVQELLYSLYNAYKNMNSPANQNEQNNNCEGSSEIEAADRTKIVKK